MDPNCYDTNYSLNFVSPATLQVTCQNLRFLVRKGCHVGLPGCRVHLKAGCAEKVMSTLIRGYPTSTEGPLWTKRALNPKPLKPRAKRPQLLLPKPHGLAGFRVSGLGVRDLGFRSLGLSGLL